MFKCSLTLASVLLSCTVQLPYHTIILRRRELSIEILVQLSRESISFQFPEEEQSFLGLPHQKRGVQQPGQVWRDVNAQECDVVHALLPLNHFSYVDSPEHLIDIHLLVIYITENFSCGWRTRHLLSENFSVRGNICWNQQALEGSSLVRL